MLTLLTSKYVTADAFAPLYEGLRSSVAAKLKDLLGQLQALADKPSVDKRELGKVITQLDKIFRAESDKIRDKSKKGNDFYVFKAEKRKTMQENEYDYIPDSYHGLYLTDLDRSENTIKDWVKIAESFAPLNGPRRRHSGVSLPKSLYLGGLDYIKKWRPVEALIKKVNLADNSRAAKERASIDRSHSPAATVLKGKLEGIVKSVVDDFEIELAKAKFDWRKHLFEKLHKEGLHTWEIYRKWDRQQSLKNGKFHNDMSREYQRFYEGENDRTLKKTFPAKEMKTLADAEAKKQAQEVLEHFVHKNMFKLSPLLKLKELGDIKVKYVHVNSGMLESYMDFTFKDKSSFGVKNQIVSVVNQFGTFFSRYPTTFHDVIVNGTKMQTPSEMKIYKEFAGTAPPKQSL